MGIINAKINEMNKKMESALIEQIGVEKYVDLEYGYIRAKNRELKSALSSALEVLKK